MYGLADIVPAGRFSCDKSSEFAVLALVSKSESLSLQVVCHVTTLLCSPFWLWCQRSNPARALPLQPGFHVLLQVLVSKGGRIFEYIFKVEPLCGR